MVIPINDNYDCDDHGKHNDNDVEDNDYNNDQDGKDCDNK